ENLPLVGVREASPKDVVTYRCHVGMRRDVGYHRNLASLSNLRDGKRVLAPGCSNDGHYAQRYCLLCGCARSLDRALIVNLDELELRAENSTACIRLFDRKTHALHGSEIVLACFPRQREDRRDQYRLSLDWS